MKKILFLLTLLLSCLSISAEEPEYANPSYGVKVERKAAIAIIDDSTYYEVTATISSSRIKDEILRSATVVVKNKEGKKIYKKRFGDNMLYGFSDGTLQIGKGNVLVHLVLKKIDGVWSLLISSKGDARDL